ncbi:MAG: Trk system potassium transporter TrkA, partial [Flavobacteriaceae bacterium]|nr:Trk system potassium transporter TrkA [Flavobacteriaceae bacterium]
GALTMLSLRLPRNASFVGKSVQEAADLYPELHFVPIAIQRYATHYTIIPRGDTQFKENDTVVFVTSKGGGDELFAMSGKVRSEIKDVMILGGSKIGQKTAKDLTEEDYNVKLVEIDKDNALDLADDLPNTLIINGDGRNVELLEEENISDMDAFIAVTGNSETNIMSCLVAKSKGVRKTIALVENMDYYQFSHSMGVDTLINKKLLAANNIFRYIRKGEVVALTKITNMNAELLEFKVTHECKVTKKKIRSLNFPRSAIIGGIIRDGEGIIPLGEFQIKIGDRVVVCCLPHSISEIEKYFF